MLHAGGNVGILHFNKQHWTTASYILVSGLVYFLANRLQGGFGYLMWVAPVYIIAYSLEATAGRAFVAAFAAYLIGRLSWFSYLASVAAIIPALLFTILLSVVFALMVLGVRAIVAKTGAWYSVFAFPVSFTAFEFLLILFSSDGTAGSIAYSQSDYLPLIQIASITGILGITFLVTLIPSSIAMSWYFRKDNVRQAFVIMAGVLPLSLCFWFGIFRLSNDTPKAFVRAGLVVLSEKYHHITNKPDFNQEKLAADLYVSEVAKLASGGAKIVVLPERAINITAATEKPLIDGFCQVAKRYKICVIIGVTNFRADPTRNSAFVIDSNGRNVIEYNKVYLIRGLEDQFTSGTMARVFSLGDFNAGIAICKDLDFPGYISGYQSSSILAIPAWDFKVDSWLHSRMAILRGIENGFAEIRAARQGRLTISDACGRVLGEADASDGISATLLGDVPLPQPVRFYTRFGNWFGMLDLAAFAFLFILFARNGKPLFFGLGNSSE